MIFLLTTFANSYIPLLWLLFMCTILLLLCVCVYVCVCFSHEEKGTGTENVKAWLRTLDDSSGNWFQRGDFSCWDMYYLSPVPKLPCNKTYKSKSLTVIGSGSCENVYVNCLNSTIFQLLCVCVQACTFIYAHIWMSAHTDTYIHICSYISKTYFNYFLQLIIIWILVTGNSTPFLRHS